MAIWTEIGWKPDDKERQRAAEMGVGGYGGDEQDRELVIQTVMPTEESS